MNWYVYWFIASCYPLEFIFGFLTRRSRGVPLYFAILLTPVFALYSIPFIVMDRFKEKLYSREYREKFRTEHSTATIERNPQGKGKIRLCIDGMPILEWFRMKFQELKEKLGVTHTSKEENKPKGGLKIVFYRI